MSRLHCAQVFYSTDSTRELSKRFGDILYKIQDLEVCVPGLTRVLPCYRTCIHVIQLQMSPVQHFFMP